MSTRRIRPHIGMKIAKRIWEGQGRRCGLCSTPEADGKPLDDVRHLLHVDHIWSIKCLGQMGINDPGVVNSLPNLWIIGKSLNMSKNHHSLRGWSKMMGMNKRVLRWCQDFSINQLRYIVKMQREIDPSWKVDVWNFPDIHFRKNDWYESLISDRAEDEAKAAHLASLPEDERKALLKDFEDVCRVRFYQECTSEKYIRNFLNPVL